MSDTRKNDSPDANKSSIDVPKVISNIKNSIPNPQPLGIKSSLDIDALKENIMSQFAPMYRPHTKPQDTDRKKIDAFISKLREYDKSKCTLTTQEIEILILSIGNNKNTYDDLLKSVPRLNSATLCSYLVNSPNQREKDEISSIIFAHKNPTYFQLDKKVGDFIPPYEFEPTDTFSLSVTGENILYQLKKEQHMLELAERSLAVAEESLEQSKRSTKYSKYATYAAIASIVIGVLTAAIQFYLN
ncbi:hypothetical protein H6A02_01640 [Veillonella magna]|uniref:hypothetical protein n=1 Tax=Veillonella magna TaxID=464322 RepID=UPI001961AD3F|nr:hypothetical protein [Veillonella magna]MBM6823688.1 hypothetical protein [Veillonella magna]